MLEKNDSSSSSKEKMTVLEFTPSDTIMIKFSNGTTIPIQTLVSANGNTEATCISGDGKKVCACGDQPCEASATTCGCITSSLPPKPELPKPDN